MHAYRKLSFHIWFGIRWHLPLYQRSFSGQFTNNAGHERDLCFSEKKFSSNEHSSVPVLCELETWILAPFPHRLPKGETRVCCEMQRVAKKGGVGEVWFVGLARLVTDGYSRLVLVGLWFCWLGWFWLVCWSVRWFVGLLVCWLRSLIERWTQRNFQKETHFLQKESGFREFLMSPNKGKVEEH